VIARAGFARAEDAKLTKQCGHGRPVRQGVIYRPACSGFNICPAGSSGLTPKPLDSTRTRADWPIGEADAAGFADRGGDADDAAKGMIKGGRAAELIGVQ
jgi:hypothetical protein